MVPYWLSWSQLIRSLQWMMQTGSEQEESLSYKMLESKLHNLAVHSQKKGTKVVTGVVPFQK